MSELEGMADTKETRLLDTAGPLHTGPDQGSMHRAAQV